MSTEMNNEAELLRASLRGDTVAFEAIVKKYQSFICAITFSATADFDKSEELAHETFISAWKGLAQLKDLSKFKGWLSSIARNIIRNSFRSQKRDVLQKSVSLDQIQEDRVNDNEPSEAVITKEQQAFVQQALKQIPEKYREPLVLFYREQQSVKQVAQELDMSEQAAKQRLSRGRKMLKDQVAAMVEQTIRRTAPGKAFTTAVIASVAGIVVKGSGVAAAAGIVTATSATGTSAGAAAVMSGITAKIITAAVVMVIGAGAAVAYKHINKPVPGPEICRAAIVLHQEGDKPDKINEKATEQPSDETYSFATTQTSGTEKSSDLPPKVTQQTDENNSTASKADSMADQSDDNLTVGGMVKSEDGNPVAGVDIQLLWDVKRSGMRMLGKRKTVTDPNGRWECQITGESEDILVCLSHCDYLSKFGSYRPSFDNLLAKSAVLVMTKGLQVSGFVFDVNGCPISDALIMPPYSITCTDAVLGIQESAKTTRTDANGCFFLGGVKPGPQDIAIDANGYAPAFFSVDVIAEMQPVEFTLDRGQNLTGIVADINGAPLSEVKVIIDRWAIEREDINYLCYKYFNMLRRQTITDANGYYTIEHLPFIGNVEMAFVKRSHLLTSYLKNDMAQSRIKNVTMYPVPTITGIVIDADSEKPITEFEVVAGCKWDPNRVGSWNLKTKKIISPLGNFSKTKSNFGAHELPSPGWMAVKINAKGYHQAQSPWMRIDQEFSPITIRLKKAETLSSTLFYSDDVPVSNVDVILIEPSSWVSVGNGKLVKHIPDSKYSITQTDPNGYFEFSAPPEPTKILVLDYDEYLVADTNDLKDKMTLTGWAYVTGILETDSIINSNITVQISPERDPNTQIRWMSDQTTNADRRFEFFYIPAIPQKISYGSAEKLEINPRPNQVLELQLSTIKPTDYSIEHAEKSQ